MRTFALCVWIAVASLACRREPEPAPPPVARANIHKTLDSPLVGCYVLDWTAPASFRRAAGVGEHEQLPRSIRLTGVRATPWHVSYVIVSPDTASSHMLADWELAAPSEATLNWSTGFVGFTIDVPVAGNALGANGVARTFSDVPEPPERAEVRIARVPC